MTTKVTDIKKAKPESKSSSISSQRKLGDLLELSDDQKRRLKKWLKKRCGEWETDTEEMRSLLKDNNDLVEGVVDDTDFPWPGASNIHVDITGIYMRVFQSTFKRSILGADMIWSAELDVETMMTLEAQSQDVMSDIGSMMNDKAIREWNIAKCLKGIMWVTLRDGVSAMQVTWAEEYEPATDTILIESSQDFVQEFPFEESGMTEEEYLKTIEQIDQEASPDNPLEVEIEFEKRTYYGNKGEIVEAANLVTFPATAPGIEREHCEGYGQVAERTRSYIRQKGRDEVFYKDAVDRLLRKRGGTSVSDITQSKDWIEGVSRSGDKEFRLFTLAVWFPLEKKGGEERKLLLTYCKDHDEILAVMDYPYRVDYYAIFRVEDRPGRLRGKSIPEKTRDMNDEVDTQHNQRVNSRTVSTVPSFKAENGIKKDFDPNKEENRFRPGVVFWLPPGAFDKFDQFRVQPTDLGESMQEESNDMRILDMLLGASVAMMSGQPNTADPNAPGNKTAMLINQSNLRLDDPLDTFREGVEAMGEICLSHLYQFGPSSIQFMMDGPRGPVVKTLYKKFLRKGVKMRMKAVTVADNPDAEMAKAFQDHQMLMSEPMFAQNPKLRVESMREVMKRGRRVGRNRLLPTVQEMQAEMVNVQKQAMMQMEAEKAAAAQQAQADAVKSRMGAVRQDQQINAMAEKSIQGKLDLPEPVLAKS